MTRNNPSIILISLIVGSVDGNRIWGKELKNVQLYGVCWSADSRLLLFSMANGEVHIYDGMGGFVSKMNIQCLSNSGSANNKVVTLHWYSGKHGLVHRDAPTLAICYDNGRMQIMRDENDESKCLTTKKDAAEIFVIFSSRLLED